LAIGVYVWGCGTVIMSAYVSEGVIVTDEVRLSRNPFLNVGYSQKHFCLL
jgi:hypothetical protein